MSFRRLFLFVEGDDDERFFRSVFGAALQRDYQDLQVVQYSGLKREKVRAWLRSVLAMQADYIYVRDLDRYPCVTAAKGRVCEVLPQLDPERIQIVKAEIESWYCAGIREDHPWGGLEVARRADTQTVTKEEFAAAVHEQGEPRISALLSALETFDLDTALRRNESLRRFSRKFLGT